VFHLRIQLLLKSSGNYNMHCCGHLNKRGRLDWKLSTVLLVDYLDCIIHKFGHIGFQGVPKIHVN